MGRRIPTFSLVLGVAVLVSMGGSAAVERGPLVWGSPVDTGPDTSAGTPVVTTDPTGHVIAFTTAFEADGPVYGDHDLHLSTYRPDGTMRWERRFGTPAADFAVDVVTDAVGDIYVSWGTAVEDRGPRGVHLRKYSAAGELVWSAQSGGSWTSTAYELDVVGDRLYGAQHELGVTHPPAPPVAARIVEFDLDGVELSSRPVGEAALDQPGPGYASNLGPALDGGLLYTTVGPDRSSVDLVRTDEQGEVRWRNTAPVGAEPVAVLRAKPDAFGNVGVAWQLADDQHAIWVRKVDPMGRTLWTTRIANTKWRGPVVELRDLAMNGGGELVVGAWLASGSGDITVAVLGLDGTTRLVSVFGEHRDRDDLRSVAPSAQGRVFLGGSGLDALVESEGGGWVGRLRLSVASAPMCDDVPVTIMGTDGPDTIRGTTTRDVVSAGAGADTITARRGADVICGGPGSDTIDGGTGPDEIFGQGGEDIVDGAGGRDFVHGGARADVLVGGLGRDRVWGGGGVDECWGEQLRCEIKHRTRHDEVLPE